MVGGTVSGTNRDTEIMYEWTRGEEQSTQADRG